MQKHPIVAYLLLLIVVNLFLYWPNPRMGYVLDDHYVVAQNPVVKNPSWEGVWTSGLFDAAHRNPDSQLRYYRPIVSASLAFDYQMWGNSPFAMRMVNVMIHLANSVLVFVLMYLLFLNQRWALIGSALFSVLPVQEWSVRYIVGRADLLAAFFSLLMLVLLVRFLREENRVMLWAGIVCFVAAVLCKESSLLNVALVTAIALAVTKSLSRSVRVTMFFFMAAGSYYFLRQVFYPINSGGELGIQEWASGLGVALEYALRMLVPFSAGQWIPQAYFVGLMMTAGVFAILISGILRARDRRSSTEALAFGIVWMIVGAAAFVVTQRIIGRLGPVLSEHFLYLQSVGFVLLLAVMIERMSRPNIRLLSFGVFFLYFLLLSFVNGRYWTSEQNLLGYVSHLEKRNEGVAHEQLIMRYVPDKRAVVQLIKTSKSGDTQSLWYRRLGDIYRSDKQYPQAKEALARAVDLNPHNIEAINELAVCHLETGQIEEGIKLLNGSLLISNRQSEAFRLLGVLNYRMGRFAQAVPFLKRAWEIDPDQSEAALHLMMAYFFNDDQPAYLQAVDQVSEKFTDSRLVLGFTAGELFSHGYIQEALKVVDQSGGLLALDPDIRNLAGQARDRTPDLPK